MRWMISTVLKDQVNFEVICFWNGLLLKSLAINCGTIFVGFGPIEVTQKRGYRFGTFSAFIEPILDRKNLYVSRYSQATKVPKTVKNCLNVITIKINFSD